MIRGAKSAEPHLRPRGLVSGFPAQLEQTGACGSASALRSEPARGGRAAIGQGVYGRTLKSAQVLIAYSIMSSPRGPALVNRYIKTMHSHP